MKPTDIRVESVQVFFLPVETRMPLKFGTETLTSADCVRVCVGVADRRGHRAEGWGETPISVQWAWPSRAEYSARLGAMKQFCLDLARAWTEFDGAGHPVELGDDFSRGVLDGLIELGGAVAAGEPMPHLAALICASAFDLALHDAFGVLHERDVYRTYTAELMNRDLAAFLEPAAGSDVSFAGRYPADFLDLKPPGRIPAWHLVGGLDPLDDSDRTGAEPDDGYPVTLRQWIEADGLTCLKVKLRGIDADWDYERLVRVGRIAIEYGVRWLSADFNCTVRDPDYVNGVLDRLRDNEPRTYGMVLYVEQPFPYDLQAERIDARSVAARKPLFLDESAHDWRFIRLGRELGWSGVALKTCKTQSGAILSQAWAKAHGMPLMVQDLTNAMLAQIAHLRLGAHAGTIMGVETNSMQFYPEASAPEAAVHPGMYRRRAGAVDLSTLAGPGFGYRLGEIERTLPEPALRVDRPNG